MGSDKSKAFLVSFEIQMLSHGSAVTEEAVECSFRCPEGPAVCDYGQAA